jgi:hypothetical protein
VVGLDRYGLVDVGVRSVRVVIVCGSVQIISVVLEFSDIFKGVILGNFISKISNLVYVFIYCAVQWRFCCHSAAVCVSVLVKAQTCTLHVHTCSGRNRITPLMRRPNTDSTPNKPVTPRNQLLIR